jgi:arsenate reductase
MDDIRIFHNPRCSKSREALALLQARGHQPLIIEYLKTAPTEGELRTLLQQLGLSARELLRSGEDEYQALGLADASLTDADLLQAIAAHPQLLQRPIVVRGGRAVIARPPELLQQLL